MKNTRLNRWVVVLALTIVASSSLVLLGQSPTTAPAEPAPAQPAPVAPPDAAPATQPSGEVQDLFRQFQHALMEFRAAAGGPDSLVDPAQRDAAAPKVLPALKRMIEIIDKMEKAEPAHAEEARQMRLQYQTLAATYGDADARAALEAAAKSDQPDIAPVAQASLLLSEWFRASKDAVAQANVADRADALAKQHPSNETITQIFGFMATMGPSNDQAKERMLAIAGGMETHTARALKAQADAEAKIKAVENKPLTIRGTTVDGKEFSTDRWKGKVVLVDFWATWCGPCLAELPRVKKVYADYHDKGLEILGVSNDFRAEDLKQFMQKNTDMPWPQLFDEQAASKGDWNPITMGFGIEGIPTMFLIDRKGICRTVDARSNFEDMIPKLLAEAGD